MGWLMTLSRHLLRPKTMHYNIWVESESLESLSPGIQKYCQSERRWKQHKRRPPGLSICSRLELRKGNKRRKRRRRRKKISFLWSFIPIPRVRLPVITTLDFFCRVFFCEKKNERGRYHLSLSSSFIFPRYRVTINRFVPSTLCSLFKLMLH